MRDLPISDNPKSRLRKAALALRQSLPMAEISAAIRKNLAKWPVFHAAETVLFYHPFRNEVDLLPLAAQFPAKNWFLPVVHPDGQMDFHAYHPAKPMRDGQYGIQEPDRLSDEASLDFRALKHTDLLIVPGLLFDRTGYRIGYGKGYFDRWMARLQAAGVECTCAGAVPTGLLREELPRDSWDLPVAWLVTEAGILPAGLDGPISPGQG